MWQAGATLHRGARASHYRGLSLRSTGSRRAGSVVVAHGPSCSVACGILPDQGPNPRPLHWQADSQPLRHQGSPAIILISVFIHDICVICMMYVYGGECVCFYLGTLKTTMLLAFKMYTIKEEFRQKKKCGMSWYQHINTFVILDVNNNSY